MKNPECVVIGDGILGEMIVRELLQRDIESLLHIGSTNMKKVSATCAAGAMLGVIAETTADDGPRENEETRYRFESSKLFESLLIELEDFTEDTLITSSGTIVVGNTQGDRDDINITHMEQASHELGLPFERLDPEDAEGLHPAREYRPTSCAFLPKERSINAEKLLEALHNSNSLADRINSGAEKVEEMSSGSWRVILCDGTEIETSTVILAAGAFSPKILRSGLWEQLILPKLFFGKGTSMTLTEVTPRPFVLRTPNRAFACGAHLVPRGNNHLYLGASNFFGFDVDDEMGIETGDVHMLLDQALTQLDVSLKRARIENCRVGFRPITADRKPLVGRVEPESGLILAVGTYRNGVVMAPLIAKHVADEIAGTEVNRLDFTNPYSPYDRKMPEIDLDELFKIASRDIGAIFREPGGHLPYNRSAELEALLGVLWSLSFSKRSDLAEFRQQVRDKNF